MQTCLLTPMPAGLLPAFPKYPLYAPLTMVPCAATLLLNSATGTLTLCSYTFPSPSPGPTTQYG